MSSPTSRSLELLKKDGFSAQVVERWNMYAKVRVDLFGFIDIVGIKEGNICGIQTTSSSNMSARVKKILGIPEAKLWLEAGGKIHVHGWSKKGKAEKRKLWQVIIKEITIADFS